MNTPDESQIENLLRRSPRPKPPEDLKDKLLQAASTRPSPERSILAAVGNHWLRRWWPALAPAAFSLICVAVLAVQQKEIRAVKQGIQSFSAEVAAKLSAAPVVVPANEIAPDASVAEAQEIARLQELAGKLSADIFQLEQVQAQNKNLRAQLATPAGLSAEEADGLNKARERADRIKCVNNMKQMALAARLWASDNMDHFPPDIICLSNEMNTPKILVCPADIARPVAPNFGSFTPANCSYEWFLNPPGNDLEPSRILTRCPIHGNVGLYDGSVQGGVANEHPDWLVQRDGKLYLESPPRP